MNYIKLRNNSLALLKRFGRTMDFVTKTEGAYNTTTGTSTDTEATTAFFGVSLSPTFSQRQDSRVTTESRRVLAVLASDPDHGSHLRFDSRDWKILFWQKTQPAGTAILYEMVVE